MPVCITLNSIDYMQEVWQTEQNYACPLVYHCHQSQLFQLGYGSSIQMINTSPVQSASKHPRNSTVHTSGVTQSLYTFCRSHCTLLWCGFALALEGQWARIWDCRWWQWHLGWWRRMFCWICVVSDCTHRLQRWIAAICVCLQSEYVSDGSWSESFPSCWTTFVNIVCVFFIVLTLIFPFVKPSCASLFGPSQVLGTAATTSASHSAAAAKQFKVTRWTANCKHSVLLLPWHFKWKYLRGSSQTQNFHKVHFQASIEYTDGEWKQRGRLVTFIVVKAAAERELKELAQDLLLLQPSKEKTLLEPGGRRRGSNAVEELSAWRVTSMPPIKGRTLLLDTETAVSEIINQSYKIWKIRHQKAVTHPLKPICESINQTQTAQQTGSWHYNITCSAS